MASNGIINPNQIRHEIKTLKSQKQEIEARISLLESQLHQQHSSSTNDSCSPISAVQVSKKSQRRLCESPLAEIGEKRRRRTTETEMSERQEENKKPGDQAAYIKLTVSSLGGNDTFFRMKRSTKLKKLMTTYCDFKSVDFWSTVFLFNVRRIREDHTPDELKMEDGDVINAFFKIPRKDYDTDSS